MTGIFSKLRVIALGDIHSLLDKAIDMNSVPVLEQYVRDIETALDQLRNQAAVQAGGIRTLDREIGDIQHNIETQTDLVKKIMAGTSPNKETLARAKGTQIVQWQKDLPERQAQLELQRKNSAQIDSAVAALDLKHTTMVNQVRNLRRMDATTKAQEHAAASLNQAGHLVSGANGVNVDDLQHKMQERSDVANEKFTRAMGSVAVAEDPTQQAEVDDFLASLTPEKDVSDVR